MEPLKPSVKQAILTANPQAAPEEIEEYERLLSERFVVDPDVPTAPVPSGAAAAAEHRLLYLHQKLFGGSQALGAPGGPSSSRSVRDRDPDPDSSAS